MVQISIKTSISIFSIFLPFFYSFFLSPLTIIISSHTLRILLSLISTSPTCISTTVNHNYFPSFLCSALLIKIRENVVSLQGNEHSHSGLVEIHFFGNASLSDSQTLNRVSWVKTIESYVMRSSVTGALWVNMWPWGHVIPTVVCQQPQLSLWSSSRSLIMLF